MTEAFIYDAVRTPRGRGKKTGSLHGVKPISLVVGLIDELRRRFPGVDPERIDDVVLGIVSPLGDQGSDLAKTARSRPACRRRSRACRSTGSAAPGSRR